MAEYVSDHRDRRAGRDEAPVDGDHLLMLSLLYTRTAQTRSAQKDGRADPGAREGYTSLESLREVSGLPARRVWGLIDDLQESDLVSCIWDSRALEGSSTRTSGETAGESRFLRGTQVGLTAEGRSYPPLHEYHRLQDPGRRAPRDTDRPRRQEPDLGRRRSPGRKPERGPTRIPERETLPPRGYRVYRPRERALLRLKVLACAFVLFLLALVVALLLLF